MRFKLSVTLALVFSSVLFANVESVVDWDAFERDGKIVSSYALQGPINDRSAMENCLVAAAADTKRFEEKGYRLAQVACVPAGFKELDGSRAGYQVIIYKANR